MQKEDFFSALMSDCYNIEEKAISILCARGFFIDQTNDGFYLSDNSATEDLLYLQELLKRYHLGVINGTKFKDYYGNYEQHKVIIPCTAKIEIFNNAQVENVINAFCETTRISFPICRRERKWSEFYYRLYPEKVPVKYLEPYVAFLVKALSACGVWTCYSCDGNHPDGNNMVIIGDYPYDIWEEILFEQLPVSERIKIIRQGLNLDSDKYEIYYEVIKAADYLYNNRAYFRNIKKDAIAFATRKYRHTHNRKEIEKKFISNCKKCFLERRLD